MPAIQFMGFISHSLLFCQLYGQQETKIYSSSYRHDFVTYLCPFLRYVLTCVNVLMNNSNILNFAGLQRL